MHMNHTLYYNVWYELKNNIYKQVLTGLVKNVTVREYCHAEQNKFYIT